MSDEVDLFDCLPELKGANGESLGVASVVLKRAAFAGGDLYLHMVTEQGGSELSDLALISGEDEREKKELKDSREAFNGPFAALSLGATDLWHMKPLLERSLTLNEATSPVVLKFPNQREATFFSVTVAAATALLKAVSQRNLLLAQLLTNGRRVSDQDELGADKEITLTAVSLFDFDAKTLEMGKSHTFTKEAPTARLTSEWLKSEAGSQASFLNDIIFGCEGNEALLAVTDEMLRGHWHKLEGLIDTGDGRSHIANASFTSRGSQGGTAVAENEHAGGVNKVYVIGVRVTSISDAAEAQKLRLRSKLQHTGAMSLGVNVAEMQRVRSSSLRRSLPPQHDSPVSKDTSLSDEINKARASMKHVDESEIRSRGNSNAPTTTSPPLHPAAIKSGEAAKVASPDNRKASMIDAEVARYTADGSGQTATRAPQPSVPLREQEGADDYSDVCVSPVTMNHFNTKKSPVTPLASSSSFQSATAKESVAEGPIEPIVGDDSYRDVQRPKAKKKKQRDAAPPESQQDQVVLPVDEASPNEDVGIGVETEEQAPDEEELSYEELVRQAAKLKKKKTKLEAFEIQLSEMEGEILRRSALMTEEQSELADERQRLEHLRAVLEAQQHQHQMEIARNGSASINIPPPGREVSSSKTSRRRGDQTRLGNEQQPLLTLHGDPNQYVFRVSTEFYDSKDLPPGLWRRMPITAAYVRYVSLFLPAAIVILGGLAASLALLAWRVSEGETHLWPMLLAFIASGLVVGVHASNIKRFLDLYHAVDQSMNNNSGTNDASPLAYEWSPMTVAVIVFTMLGTFGSVGCVAYSDSPATITGVVLGIASTSFGIGSVLSNLSLMTHVLWYRVASTIPRQHGALFTRIGIRAATARYQYAKQLVEMGSRRFSPTVLALAISGVVGIAFCPYYMFIINNSEGGHLAGAIAFTAAAAVLFVLVLLLSSWEGATKQVIGNIGVQADRWVRGDYNNESDAKLEDYVAAQQLLVNHVLSGEYARWTIDVVPFLRAGKSSDVVPNDYRNMVISWHYRIVALMILLLGIVMIPIVASHVGEL